MTRDEFQQEIADAVLTDKMIAVPYTYGSPKYCIYVGEKSAWRPLIKVHPNAVRKMFRDENPEHAAVHLTGVLTPEKAMKLFDFIEANREKET